jgi:acyl-coenzyme A thioesterase PaaI-like protein
MRPDLARRLIHLWPPLLFSGVRIRRMDKDMRRIEVDLRLTWWNRNAVGTLFGGSLFAMADPFYPLMLQHNLGPGYSVWTKAADIAFLKPGRKLARATFLIEDAEVDRIRSEVTAEGRSTPTFPIEILDQDGEVLATINAQLHVRARSAKTR